MLALGYHYDDSLMTGGSLEGGDSVNKLAAALPLGEQVRLPLYAKLLRRNTTDLTARVC